MGPYAHAYFDVNGKLLDVSNVDPSFAGAAGANALVTTAPDLIRFLDALLAGRLFRHPATLKAMLKASSRTAARATWSRGRCCRR
jgi:D-alanyl-D-alanine carboxypeptidase